MLDQQKVWWQWLQKQQNIYKSILHLSTESPKWNIKHKTQSIEWFIQMFRNFINLAVNQNRIKPSKFINILYFFIVSEKLSKLSIPSNNTKLTMFYKFHKNWQCVKSALNCFCFWSLYIFLGNLLCIWSWGESKNPTKSIYWGFWKRIQIFWGCTLFTHVDCMG